MLKDFVKEEEERKKNAVASNASTLLTIPARTKANNFPYLISV